MEFISVICPIYNEEKHLKRCIDSLLKTTYPHNKLEIIFVDGMSTDASREIVKGYQKDYPFIQLIDNPEQIVPYALNYGIAVARGNIIFRIDAHAFFPDDYFAVLSEKLMELDADNVGGVCNTIPYDDTLIARSIAIALSSPFGMGNSYFRIGSDSIRQVDTVPFGCFKRTIFEKIGLFDYDLVRNQDDEFNGRIIRNGGKIFLIPNVRIDYVARKSLKNVYNMFYQYGLFKPLVNYKLKAVATVRQCIPPMFVGGIFLGVLASFISVYCFYLFLLGILAYLSVSCFFSLRAAVKEKMISLFGIQVVTYAVIHFAYGFGYWKGILNLFFRKRIVVKSNH